MTKTELKELKATIAHAMSGEEKKRLELLIEKFGIYIAEETVNNFIKNITKLEKEDK